MAKTTTSTPQENTRRGLPRPRLGSASGSHPVEAPRRPTASPVTFFQEARAELRKVTWPTRQEATNLTVAVIGMTLAIAIFLGVIDAGLDKLVSILLGTG